MLNLGLMWSKRVNEYDADKYACELGYGFELAKGLDAIGTNQPQESLFRALYSTHPYAHDRIGWLQQMGVRYYKTVAQPPSRNQFIILAVSV